MKLVHPEFPCQIIFRENIVNTLIIESPKIFAQLIYDLSRELQNAHCGWVLSTQGEVLDSAKKCQMIIDPYSTDLNQKKIINQLYDDIKMEVGNTELLIQWKQLTQSIEKTIENIIEPFEFALEYTKEIEVKDFLKFLTLRFSKQSQSLTEELIDYMVLSKKVVKTQIFIFVNLKSYLEEEQIEFLMEQARYEKIFILLVESADTRNHMDSEEVIVIDKDWCVIYK